MKVSITRGNSKIGKVLNVSLPPGDKTCRPGAPCLHSCYARRCAYARRDRVKQAWDGNLEFYRTHPDAYFYAIHQKIRKSPTYTLFRWHVGGDIPDALYFWNMCWLAARNPNVRFIAFTKKYELLNEYIVKGYVSIPRNLRLIVSAWPGLKLPTELRKQFPVAWMKDRCLPDTRIPENAKECKGGCDKCLLCWDMKAGESVVFNKH